MKNKTEYFYLLGKKELHLEIVSPVYELILHLSYWVNEQSFD